MYIRPTETSAQAALYQDLVAELRCLVCDNQSLSDSNADLAQDLRRKVAEMIRRGDDRDAIVDYMVDRYGHFVLYRPPVSASTLLLWFGPFVVFLLALVALFRHTRRQARESVPKHSEDRLSEARALLKDGDDS